MGEQSKISWCDSTANFWSGCTKVYLPGLKADQSGCDNCYAEELSGRFPTFGKWGKGQPRRLHESAFKMAHKLNRKPWVCDECGKAWHENPSRGELHPCHCGAEFHRRRIFSLSLGDWLDPEVPVEWLARMLDTTRQCDQVEWILCTKRPELFEQRIMAVQDWSADFRFSGNGDRTNWYNTHCMSAAWRLESPPNHITLLASVENQAAADERIPQLLRIPAARRGLSLEPLLGPVSLSFIPPINKNAPCVTDALTGITYWPDNDQDEGEKLDWLIIGGESGKNARPCNIDWVRSLVRQGQAAGVPVFVKQLGSNAHGSYGRKLSYSHQKAGDPSEWPEDLRVQEWPK